MSAKALLTTSSTALALKPGILQQLVAVGDIGLVMLVVVKFERFLRHIGLKRIVGIGKGGKFESHRRRPPYAASFEREPYLVAWVPWRKKHGYPAQAPRSCHDKSRYRPL